MPSSKTIVFVYLTFVLLVGCSDYKYGIREDSYPDLFPKEPPFINNVLKYNEEYSWLTKVPLSGQTVEIEHGVMVSEEDRDRLDLPRGEFLFSSIAFEEPTKLVFSLSYAHEGSPLAVVGTYVFELSRDAECTVIDRNLGWTITRLDKDVDTIVRECPFGLIRISRMPEGAAPELVEDIHLSVNGKPHDFSFTIEWHKASTALWRINTIT